MEKPKNEPQLDAQEMLMYGLDFTEHDLEVNRDGYMSKRQWELLRNKSVRLTKGYYVGLWFVVIAAVILVAVILIDTEQRAADPWTWYGLIGMSALGIVGSAVYLTKQISRIRQDIYLDLDKGDVSAASGVPHLNVLGGGQIVSYELRMDDLKFNLTEEEFYGFRQGRYHIIYYAPHTEIILSAEPH